MICKWTVYFSLHALVEITLNLASPELVNHCLGLLSSLTVLVPNRVVPVPFARTVSYTVVWRLRDNGTDQLDDAPAHHLAEVRSGVTAASAPQGPFVDREHFERHGYCIVRNMLTEEDLTKVEDDYDVLVNQRAQRWLESGYLSTTHGDKPFDKRLAAIAADLPQEIQESELRPFLHEMDTMSARCKGTFEFFFSEGLLAAVEQLVGPEITLNPIQHIRPYIPHRFAGGYGSTTWHQDQAVTQEEADGVDIVTCWIPFTAATRENGALRILKNVTGEKNLVIGHHDDDETANLWPGGEPVDCLLNRGDAVFISAYALRCQLAHARESG